MGYGMLSSENVRSGSLVDIDNRLVSCVLAGLDGSSWARVCHNDQVGDAW